MKIKFLPVIALAFLLGADYPRPQGFVNDFGDVLPQETETALETELRAFEAQTSIEIAVVTVPSLDGRTVEDYAVGLASDWGVGKKGKDNGVLLLFAFNEKKVRIEVGLGIQPYLTDAKASRIIRETIGPTSKSGKHAEAIIDGTHAVMTALGTMPLAERTPPAARPAEEGWSTWVWVLFIAGICGGVIGIFWLFAWLDKGGGGGWSSGDGSSGSTSGWFSGGSSSSGSSGGSDFGGGGFDGGGASGDL